MPGSFISPRRRNRYEARVDGGAAGSGPEDVVGAASYLLSDEARYVNGTNIHVSGAWGV